MCFIFISKYHSGVDQGMFNSPVWLFTLQHSHVKHCRFTYPKWPTPLTLLSLCYVVATVTVSPSGWMLSSVLHIFITDLCNGQYWLRSGPAWPEWPAGRQTYSAISQSWQLWQRHMQETWQSGEEDFPHTDTSGWVRGNNAMWVCPSLIHWRSTVWLPFDSYSNFG